MIYLGIAVALLFFIGEAFLWLICQKREKTDDDAQEEWLKEYRRKNG